VILSQIYPRTSAPSFVTRDAFRFAISIVHCLGLLLFSGHGADITQNYFCSFISETRSRLRCLSFANRCSHDTLFQRVS